MRITIMAFFTITLLHQIAIKYEDYYHGVKRNFQQYLSYIVLYVNDCIVLTCGKHLISLRRVGVGCFGPK